jgi:GntR family transcriptional regulator
MAGPPGLRAFRLLDAALRQGRYLPGERLPPERDLARDLGISRTSLRQALTALAENGRVRAAANRGWYVLGVPISEGPNGFTSFSAQGRARGLAASARILVQRVRPATLEEADVLGLPPTAPILDLERLRSLDGVPICVSFDRMPAARVDALVDRDLTDRSLTAELEQGCGLVATRCSYEVEATPADDRRAALLGVAPGSPLLVTHEVLFDQRDQPISLGLTAYRGDAFRFRATLFRS